MIIKLTFLFFVILLTAHGAFAQQQSLTWVKQSGGNESDYCADVLVATDGSIYTAGSYTGTAVFGSFTLQADFGSFKGYIYKTDVNGTILWAKKFGDNISTIALGPQGTLYVTGDFQGTQNFGSLSLTSVPDNDVNTFLMKIDANGDALWAENYYGSSYAKIVSDASGNVYMGGTLNGGIYQQNVTLLTATPGTQSQIYLAKFDANGTPLWLQEYGGTGVDAFSGLDVDAAGNILVTGMFNGITSFGTSDFTSFGSWDISMFKTDLTGQVLWAKQFGGSGLNRTNSIAADSQGNTYITGQSNGIAQFGTLSCSSTNYNSYLCKINSSGTPIWIKSYFTNLSNYPFSADVVVDNAGNTYMTGCVVGTYQFSPQHIVSVNDYAGTFVLKNDPNGNVLWAKGIGGIVFDHENYGNGSALDFDAAGNIYLGGIFTGSLDYTPVLYAGNANFSYDTYLAKIGTCAVNPAVNQSGNTITAVTSGASYQWINCNTNNTPINGATSQSYTPSANGSYAVIVTQNGCSSTSTCVSIGSVGTEEISEGIFSVYPNPNTGLFTIVNESPVTLTITNAEGKLISMGALQAGENVIDMQTAESGIYFITASFTDRQSSVQRVSIVK